MATSTIIRLAIRALNHPAARSLAKQVMGLLKKEGPENKKKLSKLGLNYEDTLIKLLKQLRM